MARRKDNKAPAPQKENTAPQSGMPGDGAGRTYDPESQHAGVWPASGPPSPDPNAQYQPMASFGQGERGAAGFEDSGRSEVRWMPPGDVDEEDEEASKSSSSGGA